MSLSGGGYRDDRPPYRGDRGGGPAYDNRGSAPYYRDDRYDNYSSGPSRGGDRDSRGGGYECLERLCYIWDNVNIYICHRGGGGGPPPPRYDNGPPRRDSHGGGGKSIM